MRLILLFSTAISTTVLGGGPAPVTIPYVQDFESQALCPNDCQAACALSDRWTNLTSDDSDWMVDRATTPTFGTGPTVDHTLGTGDGRFLYMETSFPCNSSTVVAVLRSPPIDLTGVPSPAVEFWYHQFGNHIGTLHLDVLNEAGGLLATDVMPPISDNQNEWQKTPVVDLQPFVSQSPIRLRIRGQHSGAGSEGDMAIDDIRLFDFVVDPVFDDRFEGQP